MIPASITSSLSLFQASVQAAQPIAQAGALTRAALLRAGSQLLSDIDAAAANYAATLDAPDPSGYAGDLVNALLTLSSAADDQYALVIMRGYVGRAVFNLAQS